MTPAPRLVFPTLDDDDTRVSRFDVERYHCGELTGDRRSVVEAALANDVVLKAFFDDLVASDAAFLIEQPVATMLNKQPAPSVWSRLSSSLSSLSSLRLPALASAAAAVVVVVVVVNRPVDGDVAGDGHRTKGGHAPAIGFFVKSGDGARVGVAGEALHTGDQIQLAVTDADKRAMIVVGIDGHGTVSVYAAETIGTQNKGHDGPRVLPASLILDDTAGTERFFVVYGNDLEHTQRAVRAAADRLGKGVAARTIDLAVVASLDLDASLTQSSVHIVKVN